MSKNRDGGAAVMEEHSVKTAGEVGFNHTVLYRRLHPAVNPDRCSFGIDGQPGLVVIHNNLFLDGKIPDHIVFSCPMVSPKVAVAKVEKAEAQAAKAAERAAKAQAKMEAQTAKLKEKQEKAVAALAAAQAKIAAAAETPSA